MKETINAEGVRAVWDKYRYAVLIVAIGAGLMLLPTGRGNADTQTPKGTRDLQTELEAALSKIDGVGQAWVLLTEESDGTRTLAENRKVSFRGEEYSENVETVRNGDAVVVTRTEYPTYRGALVVCDGGDRPAVQLAVTQAVGTLTGLPASKITVVKCQS